MTPPLVSILTPTYNHERYIRQCIESVLAQSYPQWEMLIVDDGSTDDTAEAVRSYSDPRIRLIARPHRGIHALGQTYNEALTLAWGEHIAILEGDDFWPPLKLEALVPLLAGGDIALAYGVAQVVTADGTLTEQTAPSRRLQARLPRSVLTNDPIGSAVRPMLLPPPEHGMFPFPCTVVIRRTALEAIGGFHTVGDGHAVDRATALHLALRGRFAFVDSVMGYWRRHPTSVNWSLRLEEFVREDYRYLWTFAQQHRERLRLTDMELGTMDRLWKQSWVGVWRLQGRFFLVQRNWGEARRRFWRTSFSRDTLKGRAISLIGLVGSALHTDIEGLWRRRSLPSLDEAP